jgi:hypothetical protein
METDWIFSSSNEVSEPMSVNIPLYPINLNSNLTITMKGQAGPLILPTGVRIHLTELYFSPETRDQLIAKKLNDSGNRFCPIWMLPLHNKKANRTGHDSLIRLAPFCRINPTFALFDHSTNLRQFTGPGISLDVIQCRLEIPSTIGLTGEEILQLIAFPDRLEDHLGKSVNLIVIPITRHRHRQASPDIFLSKWDRSENGVARASSSLRPG